MPRIERTPEDVTTFAKPTFLAQLFGARFCVVTSIAKGGQSLERREWDAACIDWLLVVDRGSGLD